MSGGSGGEKTEKATPQRMKKVREEGGLEKSQDISTWLAVAGAAITLPMVITRGTQAATEQIAHIQDIAVNPSPDVAVAALRDAMGTVLPTLAPLLVVMILIAIVSSVAQGGVHPSAKRLKPQYKHFNPINGFKKMFGKQGLWNGAKALMKTAVVAAVLYMAVKGLSPVLLGSGVLPLSSSLTAVGGGARTLLNTAYAAGLIMAAFDVFVIVRRNRKKTRMSKQEIKDEHKKTEGDPHIKGAIRSRQMAMSRNRMMAAIADADVVLTNPTHVAVALRYEPGKGAPRVVAKGAGPVAAAIRAKAEECRVLMVQDIPLARALHAACELDQEIPPHLYTAVAGVLAFVMALKRRGVSQGSHRSPRTGELQQAPQS